MTLLSLKFFSFIWDVSLNNLSILCGILNLFVLTWKLLLQVLVLAVIVLDQAAELIQIVFLLVWMYFNALLSRSWGGLRGNGSLVVFGTADSCVVAGVLLLDLWVSHQWNHIIPVVSSRVYHLCSVGRVVLNKHLCSKNLRGLNVERLWTVGLNLVRMGLHHNQCTLLGDIVRQARLSMRWDFARCLRLTFAL